MNNLKAPKEALNTMLIYYYQTLCKNGYNDPRKIIATEISNMINLSKEQSQYIIDKIDNSSLTSTEVIDSIISILLSHTQSEKVLSIKDANLMINSLKKLKLNIKE